MGDRLRSRGGRTFLAASTGQAVRQLLLPAMFRDRWRFKSPIPTMVPGVPARHATSMNRCRAVRSLAAGAEPVAVSGSAAPVTALPTEAAVADRPWVVTGVLVSRREFLQPSGLGAAGT